MSYASVDFIFFALAGVMVYHFISPKLRPWWLTILSFIWLTSWRVEWAIAFQFLITVNYFGLRFSEKQEGKLRDRSFLFLILFNALFFFILRSGGMGSFEFQTPFGTSFLLLMLMGSVFEKWRRQDKETYSFAEYSSFPGFFPFLMSGPVERGVHFLREERKSHFQLELFSEGIILVALGFIKVLVLWPFVRELSDSLVALDGVGWKILYGLVTTWETYLELSGVHDIGRGTAKFFGIDSTVNFRPVIFSKGPNDFWNRWNISIGHWIRNNLTLPLLLKYSRVMSRNIVILFSFLLMGIWHGIGFKFILFSFFNGGLVILNLWGQDRKLGRWWGQILFIILFIGNGILINLDKFSEPPINPLTLEYLYEWKFNWTLVVAFVVLMGIEFFQELRNLPDSSKLFTKEMKFALSAGLLIYFFYCLDQGWFNQGANLVPLYFKM